MACRSRQRTVSGCMTCTRIGALRSAGEARASALAAELSHEHDPWTRQDENRGVLETRADWRLSGKR